MAITPPQAPLIIIDTHTLAAFVRVWREEALIAIDTESNNYFAYQERICLIQLSTPQHDYIIDPLRVDDLTPLGDLIADPTVEIVLHDAEHDIAGLKRDFDFQFTNLFDTQYAARMLGEPKAGLANLLNAHFGIDLDKRFQREDWSQRPLSEAHLRYAQMDTHYLPYLRDYFAAELLRHGLMDEAREIFADLCDTPPPTTGFDPDSFWSMPSAKKIHGRKLTTLHKLYLWREQTARAIDLPPSRVLPDHILLSLAYNQPKTLPELQAHKSITKAQVQQFGYGILESVKAAPNSPPPKRPKRPKVSRQVINRHERLKDWRRDTAQARGIESDLVMHRNRLWELAREAPRTENELRGITGWGPIRFSLYAAEILEVLNNE